MLIRFFTAILLLPTLATADLNINYSPQQTSKFVEISPHTKGEIGGTASVEAMAYRALLQKNYDEAAQQFYQLIQQKGQQSSLLYGLALSYQKLGNAPAAINVWQRLLAAPGTPVEMKAYGHLNLASLKPNDPETLNNIAKYTVKSAEKGAIYATMGQVLLKQGKKDQALKSLELAYRHAPQNVLYAYNLAVAYDQTANKQKALSLYQSVSNSKNIGTKLGAEELMLLRKRIAFLKS